MKTTVLILVICFGAISARYYQGQRTYYQPYRADSRFRSRSVALRDEPIGSSNYNSYEAVRINDLPVRSRSYNPYEAVRVKDLPVRSRSFALRDEPIRHNDAYVPYQHLFPSAMDHFRNYVERRHVEDAKSDQFYGYVTKLIGLCSGNANKANIIEKTGGGLLIDSSVQNLLVLTEAEAKAIAGAENALIENGLTIAGKLYYFAFDLAGGMYYFESMEGGGIAFVKTNSKIAVTNVLPGKSTYKTKSCMNSIKIILDGDEKNGVF